MGHLVLVGCGFMGQALLKGWAQSPLAKNLQVSIITNHPQQVDCTKDSFKTFAVTTPQDPQPSQIDYLVLAIKPQQFAQTVPTYQACLDSHTLVISMAAGVSLDTIQNLLGGHTSVLRIMPNLPVRVQQGITAAFGTQALTHQQKIFAQQLFESVGEMIWLDDESQFHAVTALSGSGPGYLFLLTHALARAGQKLGLNSDIADLLARQTIIGSAQYLKQAPESAQMLYERMTEIKGTTAAAIDYLIEEGQFFSLFEQALTAAFKRSQELNP